MSWFRQDLSYHNLKKQEKDMIEKRPQDTRALRFHTVCTRIIQANPDEYAVSYARAGLRLDSIPAINSQCLYILTNLGRWRGGEAAAIKNILREIASETETE